MKKLILLFMVAFIYLNTYGQYSILEYYAVEKNNSSSKVMYWIQSSLSDRWEKLDETNAYGRYLDVKMQEKETNHSRMGYGLTKFLDFYPNYVCSSEGYKDNHDNKNVFTTILNEGLNNTIFRLNFSDVILKLTKYDLKDVLNNTNDYLCPQDIKIITTFELPLRYELQYSIDNVNFKHLKYLNYGCTTTSKYYLGNDTILHIDFNELIENIGDDVYYSEKQNSELEKLYFRCAYTTSEGDFTTSVVECPKFFRNVDIDKSKLYVLNDTLFLPELSSTQSITMSNMKIGHFDTIRNSTPNQEKFILDNKYGFYKLEVQENNKCPVTFNLVHPKLTLNEVVKNSGNQFWYPGEKRKDVLNLTLYSLEPSIIGNYKAEELTFEPKIDLLTQSQESILYQLDGGKEDSAQYNSSIYTLIDEIDDKLNKIEITSSNPNFIPVTKTFKLNSYQKINVADVEVADPICYYDSAEVNIGNISEGLKGNYKCVFEKDGKLIDTTIKAEGGVIKFAPSALGGGQQDINLTIYDADTLEGDAGYKERSFTKNLTLNYPDRLSIDDVEKKDLLCHNDNTGEIHIKEFSPKDGIYTFAIRNDDYSIESMDATGLKASDYQLIIENEKGCKNDSLKITINQPDTLDIENLVVKNPKCFGYSDGYINYDVTGGTGEKSFVWNDGFTEKDREEIPVGDYSVIITDRNKCKITKQMTLAQPEKLNNYFTGDYKICTGSSLTIDSKKYDSTDVFKEFLWLDENSNIYSQEQILQFDSTNCGKYILISFDEKKYDNARKDGSEIQCYTTDTLNISMSSERFDKSFLVASQSYFGDTIVLVNDTKNDDFDFKFEIPEELEEIGIQDKFYDYIVASKPGIYNLIMSIKGDDCTANEYREIEILNEIRPEDYDEQFVKTVQIVSMKMGPNPNDGNFTFDLVMTEKSDVSLSLYSISRPRLLRKDELKDNNKYSKEYNENLPVGEYMLLVRTENDNKVIKFVVGK